MGAVITDFELANQILHLRPLAQLGLEADAISGDDAAQWIDHVEKAAERDRFFCAISGFIVSGTKPGQPEG